MGVVHEPIADGVGDERFAESVVPDLRGELRGHDRGRVTIAVIEYLQQISGFGIFHRRNEKIVNDQHVRARELIKHFGIGAVRPRNAELMNKTGSTNA